MAETLSLEMLSRFMALEQWFYEEYSRTAESSSNSKTQAIYHDLAESERKHKVLLSVASSILFPGASLDNEVVSVEIPEAAKNLMETTFVDETHDLFFKMEIHLRMEEELVRRYRELVGVIHDEQVREIFQELVSDSERHHQTIREVIDVLVRALARRAPTGEIGEERRSREQREVRQLARARVLANRSLLLRDPSSVSRVTTADAFRRAREAQLQLPPCSMCDMMLERSDPVIQCDYCGAIAHFEHPQCNKFFEYRDRHEGRCPKCRVHSTARVAPQGVDQLHVPPPFW